MRDLSVIVLDDVPWPKEKKKKGKRGAVSQAGRSGLQVSRDHAIIFLLRITQLRANASGIHQQTDFFLTLNSIQSCCVRAENGPQADGSNPGVSGDYSMYVVIPFQVKAQGKEHGRCDQFSKLCDMPRLSGWEFQGPAPAIILLSTSAWLHMIC